MSSGGARGSSSAAWPSGWRSWNTPRCGRSSVCLTVSSSPARARSRRACTATRSSTSSSAGSPRPLRAQHGPARAGQEAGLEQQREDLRLLVLLRPQLSGPLDRAGQRELRAAESLDEVAAPADAERLQRAQLSVHRAVAAGNSFAAHAVAHDNALTLEQELRERARIGT